MIAAIARSVTGIEIHPAACIGDGFFVDHGMGVVVGETAEIGDNVTLYQGVTLGGTGFATGKRHPTVQDNVTIGSGAKLLGPIVVGHGAKIGANSVVIHDVPPNATVVGNPGHPVRVEGRRPEGPDADWIHLPDPVAEAIKGLSSRIAALEADADANPPPPATAGSRRGGARRADRSPAHRLSPTAAPIRRSDLVQRAASRSPAGGQSREPSSTGSVSDGDRRQRAVALVGHVVAGADKVQRAPLHLVVDTPDVLADDADRDQLDPAEQQDQDRQRAEARQVGPEDPQHDDDRDRDEGQRRDREASSVASCSGRCENEEIASSEKRSILETVYLVSPA